MLEIGMCLVVTLSLFLVSLGVLFWLTAMTCADKCDMFWICSCFISSLGVWYPPSSRLGCQVVVSKDLEGMRVTLPPATRNMAVDGFVPQPH